MNKINIRDTFLADTDCVMVRCDLSQIESRVCFMYCGTPRMVKLANSKPWEYDTHTENARVIFQREEITKDERYLAKKVVHGSQRKLQGNRMSESISKDTKGKTFIHPRQCDRLIKTYLEKFWEIEKIFFPWVEERVQRDGFLVNSWGRRVDLGHRRIDNDLYREAYSWYLQSEDADWTNQYLFLPTYHYMMGKYGWPPNGQVHDEVIGSVPLEGAYEVALVMKTAAEQTKEIPAGSGNYLCAPAGITIARTYGDKKAVEFKRLPEREEFYGRLREEGGFNVVT